MRIPIGVTLESRDGSVTRDAKVLNGIIEVQGEVPKVRKRFGMADLGAIHATVSAQLLYSWNGIQAILSDKLYSGTLSTIIGATGTSLSPANATLPFYASETSPTAATPRLFVHNRTQAWTINKAGTATAVTFGPTLGAQTYSLISLTRSGATATATLAESAFSVGDTAVIAGAADAAYNGSKTVTATTAGSSTPASDIPITITRSGTTATATTVSGSAHGLTTATAYTIAGASDSAYNGSFTITTAGGSTFTYTVSTTVFSAITGTWNPSDKDAAATLSGGNLTCTFGNTYGVRYQLVRGTVSKSTGKWAFEVTISSSAGSGILTIGVATAAETSYVGQSTASWGYNSGGQLFHNGISASGATFTTGDVIGVVLDLDGATLEFYKNGVRQAGFTGVSGTVFAAVSENSPSVVVGNFAGAFAYDYTKPATPPTGTITVTKPAVTVNPTFSYAVAGSPATPDAGASKTAQTNGGMVPGVAYINGYHCVMDTNGVIANSNSDDPTTWGALNTTTAQAVNGAGKGIARSNSNYLLALKDWSTEFFYDARNATGSPFSPVEPAFVLIGCATGDSIAEVDGVVMWMSQVKQLGRSIHAMDGLTPTKLSTPDIERILDADSLATVYAYGLKIDGHAFYLLTLVASNITLVFDMTSKVWGQWSSLALGSPVTVTSITRTDDIATVLTSTAHGLNDGDPVKIAGANQTEYNGIFPAIYVDSTRFTIEVSGSPATPATGTITATPYTETYFKLVKYANYSSAHLLMHETSGHLYQPTTSLYQDAGVPIKTFGRSTRLDAGTLEKKTMPAIRVIGDEVDDIVLVRWSDDDSQTFSGFRRVDLSADDPRTDKCGVFRRRSLEFQHVGNNPINLSHYEPDLS